MTNNLFSPGHRTSSTIDTLCVIEHYSEASSLEDQYPQRSLDEVDISDHEDFSVSDLPLNNRYDISASQFQSRELEHIKFSSYNPFPSGRNEFRIDLSIEQSHFTFPLEVSRLSSGYGSRGRGFHSGVDLLESAGAPIYAAFDGIVRISKPYAGYGNVVVLRHNNGLETVYSHNTKLLVRPGQHVRSGDQIATVGRTGRATANHLHFEIRIQGQTIDPQLVVDLSNRRLQPGTLVVSRNVSGIYATNTKTGKGSSAPTPPPSPLANISTTTSSTTTPSSPAASSSNSKPTKASTSSTTSKYHTISKGDTLSAIARRYGTTTSKLCTLNKITDKTILSLGRKLRIN